MAVTDVLETRISTRARKEQESQNYLEHNCCRQNENDIPIKDDTVAENWAKNWKKNRLHSLQSTRLEMASRKIQRYQNKAKNLYTIYFVFHLDGWMQIH